MTASFRQDFPISFAEEIHDTDTKDENATTFYVEWFDNSNEFPTLSTSHSKSPAPTVQSKVGTWELLQRSEVNSANNTQQEQQQQEQLYSHMLEKNAAELQPSQRTVQSLHSSASRKKKSKEQDSENDTITTAAADDYYDDMELFDIHKSQSRKANRSKHLRARKTVDVHIEGTLRLATSRQGRTQLLWIPDENNSMIMARPDTIQLQNNNSQALLSFSAKTFVHSSSATASSALQQKKNHAAAFYKYSPLLDNSDYSVLSTKIKC